MALKIFTKTAKKSFKTPSIIIKDNYKTVICNAMFLVIEANCLH